MGFVHPSAVVVAAVLDQRIQQIHCAGGFVIVFQPAVDIAGADVLVGDTAMDRAFQQSLAGIGVEFSGFLPSILLHIFSVKAGASVGIALHIFAGRPEEGELQLEIIQAKLTQLLGGHIAVCNAQGIDRLLGQDRAVGDGAEIGGFSFQGGLAGGNALGVIDGSAAGHQIIQ